MIAPALTVPERCTLRHMLGINDPRIGNPKPYRDCAAAAHDDPHYLALEAAGMVRRYRRCAQYDWWTTTEAGKAAAFASHRQFRWPKKKRVYSRYLSVRDCMPDLTFREFLINPDYASIRAEA